MVDREPIIASAPGVPRAPVISALVTPTRIECRDLVREVGDIGNVEDRVVYLEVDPREGWYQSASA